MKSYVLNSACLIVSMTCIALAQPTIGQEDPPPASTQSTGIARKAIIVTESGGEGGAQALQIDTIQASPGLGSPRVFSFSSNLGETAINFSADPGASGMMNLLNNKSIREEIELVDDQYEKMQEFYKERQASIMKEVQSLIAPALSGDTKKNNKSVQLRGKKIKEMIVKQQEESVEKLKELLLPHQIKRLEQVSHQVRMKSAGALKALTSGKLMKELELSDDDVEKLKDKSKEIEKDLKKQIEELKAKAKKELLKELSAKQRNKLEELMGEDFDYKPTDWQSRIRQLESRTKKPSEK